MGTHWNLISRFSDCLGCEMVNEMAKSIEQVFAPPAFTTDPGCRANQFTIAYFGCPWAEIILNGGTVLGLCKGTAMSEFVSVLLVVGFFWFDDSLRPVWWVSWDQSLAARWRTDPPSAGYNCTLWLENTAFVKLNHSLPLLPLFFLELLNGLD